MIPPNHLSNMILLVAEINRIIDCLWFERIQPPAPDARRRDSPRLTRPGLRLIRSRTGQVATQLMPAVTSAPFPRPGRNRRALTRSRSTPRPPCPATVPKRLLSRASPPRPAGRRLPTTKRISARAMVGSNPAAGAHSLSCSRHPSCSCPWHSEYDGGKKKPS
jgi:hypothetical protein